MAMVVSNMSGQLHSKLTRSLEKILEEAHASGELNLSGRKLKEFPNARGKYDLADTVIADLSKNRFGELPSEVTEFCSLERLQLYHNIIRFIPDTVVYLQSLAYLDLSRNQLSVLPCALCQLPLEVLLLSNNKLVGIPEEIGRMRTLTELDASCNEIAHLPRQIGDLPILRALNVRQNHLKELPLEITYLRLVKLDISENRISTLPNELRTMITLVDFHLSHNPLVSPPAQLCRRGRVHIFKYLEIQALKDDKKRGFLTEDVRRSHKKSGNLADLRGYSNGIALDLRHRRYNVDSGYSTSSDGLDKRWSQEVHGEEEVSNVKGQWQRPGSAPVDMTQPTGVLKNGNRSGSSTPSTISPGESMNLEEEYEKALVLHEQLEKKRLEVNRCDIDVNRRIPVNNDGMKPANGSPRFPSNNVNKVPLSPSGEVVMNGNSLTPTLEDKRPLQHIQTYREYKEALKQQRGQDVYRPRASEDNATSNGTHRLSETPINHSTQEVDSTNNYESQLLRNRLDQQPNSKQIFEDVVSKRPVQKVIPSRNSSSVTFQFPSRQSPPLSNGTRNDSCYVKPSSPVKTPSSPRLVTTSVGFVNGNRPQTLSPTPRSPKLGPRAMMWNRDVAPEKLSFTMRREFDKAREEAELTEQLRSLIESRLKMTLPEDMAPVLMDGVVLCHLANHVRPRSVASIHVPSPAVPKLTMARCRRNVDNFLEACRKIGVEEDDVCSRDDIVESFRVSAVCWTVEKLMKIAAAPTQVLAAPEESPDLISLLCLSLFVGTMVLLYFLPPPN